MVAADQVPLMERAVDGGEPLETTVPLIVDLSGTSIPLGMVHGVYAQPRIESIQDRGEHRIIVFVTEAAEESLVAPAI